MTAAPQFLRDLAVSRILHSSSPRPKGALERHDLTRFRNLTLHTAQASISLRRFSNASPRWHIQRLKRDLIAQLECVIASVAGFGLPGSPRLHKASFDGEEFPKYPTRFTNKAKLRCSPIVVHTVNWCYRAINWRTECAKFPQLVRVSYAPTIYAFWTFLLLLSFSSWPRGSVVDGR